MNKFACCENAKENAKLMPAPENKICDQAYELLKRLCDIEAAVARVDTLLFAKCCKEEQPEPCPTCLSDNVAIAIDKAQNIAANLEQILGRL